MGSNETGGRHQKETVSVSFLTVHEVDPDDFDLRVRKPEKVRRQLVEAAKPKGHIQKPIETAPESLERYRREIKSARERNDRKQGTERDQ